MGNVTALMRLTRAVVPLMLEAGASSLVKVASEAALHGSTTGAAYTASNVNCDRNLSRPPNVPELLTLII